jgi:predicted RNase H-like HicB family nuclease
MRYTVVLTEKTDGNIHVTVPALPDCTIEARTRHEALKKARETITSIIRRSEIVQLDVSTEPKSGSLYMDTPWEWFGIFKDNPAWEKLFDDAERQRTTDIAIR